MKTTDLELETPAGKVGALLQQPTDVQALYVFAHGAGANMRHAFMEQLATGLGRAGIATLRYDFPYMQRGAKRPDPPAVLETTVRAAIDCGVELAGGKPVIAGGKSMGGRMTSNALARQPDDRVKGIAFVGFPLHQPGKPGIERAEHLARVTVPMLFLQGTRDTLADLDRIKAVCSALGERATLHVIPDADHSFVVRKRETGRSSEDVYRELAATIADWTARLGPGDYVTAR